MKNGLSVRSSQSYDCSSGNVSHQRLPTTKMKHLKPSLNLQWVGITRGSMN